MDRTKLKNYAPKARREFIEAMTERAAFYGLTADKTEPIVEKGDVAVIGGRSFPIAVARKRKSLEDRIKRRGFQQTMEAMAYTWFNRLVAIRYMELHGYLDHGYRVLSHPDGKPTPEILEHAEHIDFPGLKRERVIDLKLAGNKEGELYRLLLTAQCNALHSAMPFLFERIDDETELLLPDNLLNSDSLIRKLVNQIDDAHWNEVEIIGWMYQFYISEKKDEVIGKVVASEDIPAATQLFTPNWIVKYLVQNTIGRQWLATYPDSPLRQQMEYYIEPAEQTPEVQKQLKAITPTGLNPEEMTLLDPACGSGHILVEAYDLFKVIYQERGYRAKDIPALILQKNLFGMEIDDRAAQLAAFALMMKARADDRRIFAIQAKPNVVALQKSEGGSKQAEEIAYAICGDDSVDKKLHNSICQLHALFDYGDTLGSLIRVPVDLASELSEIERRLDFPEESNEIIKAFSRALKPLLLQANLLSRKYDAVIANPPYMGNRYLTPLLKRFLKDNYDGFEKDLFSAFIIRNSEFTSDQGHLGFMTPFVWMFISSYEQLRTRLLSTTTITSLVQLEYSGFDGATVPICTFTFARCHLDGWRSTFIKLSDFRGAEHQAPRTLEAISNRSCGWLFEARPDRFAALPGAPFAFWLSEKIRECFESFCRLEDSVDTRKGMVTADNSKYVRHWYEVSYEKCGLQGHDRESAKASNLKWFPYNKGGGFRKWYGNKLEVVNWERDGEALQTNMHPTENRVWATNFNLEYIFKPNVNWGAITSSEFSARISFGGELFDAGGSAGFPKNIPIEYVLGFLNSKVTSVFLRAINPTLNFQAGNISDLPLGNIPDGKVIEHAKSAISIAKEDWDCSETSWDFLLIPALLRRDLTLRASQEAVDGECIDRFNRMKQLEQVNNDIFIKAYGLQDEISSEVNDEQVTLYLPHREEDIKRVVSYAIGCVMGRYSLDKPGLIYAHSGNQRFDPSEYKTFRADDDGIIPLLEIDWGIRDDATNRIEEFVSVAWPKEHLDENLKFVADSLGPTGSEQPRDTIRRYLATGFYRHHLSMYKKRPIYWLFSSGKQRAFQCLVYLHRYNEGTLARMRTEYVIPLQGQMAARIDQLEGDKAKATSTSHRNKIQKEQDKLKKQQVELAAFEEMLKHYADMRISLDLDDGVKVNYAKFGDLLAESKAITGGKDDE